MDRRLVALSALAWGTAAGAGSLPLLEVGQAILVPCASIAWISRSGIRAWSLFLSIGVVLLSVAAPDRLPEFAAGALAGAIVGESVRRGVATDRAVLWALFPVAVWTAGLAALGAQPIGHELRASIERLLVETGRRGELSVEGIAQLRSSVERALVIAERTWVGVAVGEFWIALLAAWAICRSMFRESMRPREPFGRFDVPDEFAWILVGGLALFLAGETLLPRIAATVGLNAIVVAAFAYVVRGTAIEWHWMERAGVGRSIRAAVLAGGWLFFLPFHGIVTGGLGLFDTWFDFRKLKTAEEREDPFRVFHQSSGDDS